MSSRETIFEIKDLIPNQYQITLNEVLFHNANGYIGVRYDFEEGYPEGYSYVRSQYINGFYDFTPVCQAESLYGLIREKQTILNVAETQTIRLMVGDEPFSMYSGTVLKSRLRLDMEKGITIRNVTWRSPQGKELELTITRMTSFHQLPLFTIEYEVLPINFSDTIQFETSHEGDVLNYADSDDPRMACTSPKYLTPVCCEIQDEASYITSETSGSNLKVCSCVKNVLSKNHHKIFDVNDHHAVCNFKAETVQGEKVVLIKYAVFCDSIRFANPKKQAELELEKALAVPISYLYRKQKEYLTDYWDNCYIDIQGDPVSNRTLRYSRYQLLQAVGKDNHCNIAAKGLSGDGYEGHYFWDSEMYILPFFTITNPSMAKTLLEYRYTKLDLARENARILGHQKGALYPWRTIMGRECSGYFPSGSAQYHISGDIAYAVIAYWLATRDLAFIREQGAEIVLETARLWMDTGCFYEGRFHINDVTGPDEYSCIVNNNYYTNTLARYNLRWAVKFYEILRGDDTFKTLLEKLSINEDEILSFQKAADLMYLPYDEVLKINPQDGAFLQKSKWDLNQIPKDHFPLFLNYHPLHLYRHQICKQADTVMAHFILEDEQTTETMRHSFNFYEKITTHDSSLSYCIFSIMAARLGMTDKAYYYYERAAQLDLTDEHSNTVDGIHIANMGGIYMSVIYGFGGFRLKEQGISISPILPGKWKGYSFRLTFEGSRLLVRVKEGGCELLLETGNPKTISVYGKSYLLENTIQVSRPPKVPVKYQAVIFDLDGVICNTDHYHSLAWKSIADEIGVAFDETANNRLRGVSRMESLEILLGLRNGDFSDESKLEYAEKKNGLYRRYLENMSPQDLDPDAKSTLDRLKEQGYKLAIGSSSKNARFILKKLGLEDYFHAVSDGTNITRSKPDPEVFLKASEFLGIEPRFCLVVEDAKSGLEAAKAAGMDSAAIGDAVNYSLANYQLKTLSDLLQYL